MTIYTRQSGKDKGVGEESASTQGTEGKSEEFHVKQVYAHYKLKKEMGDLADIGNDSSAWPPWEWRPEISMLLPSSMCLHVTY